MNARYRVALALWIVCAFVIWNVVFDRVVVIAGRQYVHAAALAEQTSRPYERIDDWMPAAVSRGVRLASLVAGLIALAGIVGIVIASRRDATRAGAGPPAGHPRRSAGFER
jgi:hypothetical protein